MNLFATFDEALIRSQADEFLSEMGISGRPFINCLHTAADHGRNQMVFTLALEGGLNFAMKSDFVPGQQWIEKEFNLLKDLEAHFSGDEKFGVIAPVYLGRDRSFHVTAFTDGPTASDVLHSPKTPEQARQVFRRAGGWLDRLHRFSTPEPQNIWTNWIFDEIQNLQVSGDPRAEEAIYRPYFSALRQDAEQFQEHPCERVFSHADFHGRNLILANGKTVGLDLAYAHKKPALYDVVDFLMEDLRLPGEAHQIGPGGIRTESWDYFFKLYRHPIPAPLMSFHLRAALLIRLLKITQTNYANSAYKKAQFNTILDRLKFAFSLPLG